MPEEKQTINFSPKIGTKEVDDRSYIGNNASAGKNVTVKADESTHVAGDGNTVSGSTAEQTIGTGSNVKGDQIVEVDNRTVVNGNNNTVYDTQAAAYQKKREELQKTIDAGKGDYGNVGANIGMGLLRRIPLVGMGITADAKSKAAYAQGELDKLDKQAMSGQFQSDAQKTNGTVGGSKVTVTKDGISNNTRFDSAAAGVVGQSKQSEETKQIETQKG